MALANSNTHVFPAHSASPWRNGALAAVISVVLNVVLFLVGRAADLIPETVSVQSPTGEGPMTAGPVIVMSIVPVVVAMLVYRILRRTTARPARVFRIVGGGLLVVSLLLPFGIPDVPAKMALTLDLMHVMTGLAILILVPRVEEG